MKPLNSGAEMLDVGYMYLYMWCGIRVVFLLLFF